MALQNEEDHRKEAGIAMYMEHDKNYIVDIKAPIYLVVNSFKERHQPYRVIVGTVLPDKPLKLKAKRFLNSFFVYPTNIRDIGVNKPGAKVLACSCHDFIYRGPPIVEPFMGYERLIPARDTSNGVEKCKHMWYVEECLKHEPPPT